MRLTTLTLAATGAIGLSACVVLDTAPPEAVGPGPFLTGNFNAPAAAPAPVAAPDLGSQLAGRTLSHPDLTDRVFVLDASGALFTRAPNGAQLESGRWYTEGRQLCFEHRAGTSECTIAVVSGSTLRLTQGDGRVTTYTLS